MTGRVRVVLHVRAPDRGGPAEIAEAYHRISARLSGTPGLLGNELMRSVLREHEFMVMSEWADLDAFRSWEEGAEHREQTAPLRPYQISDSSYNVYIVDSVY